MATTKKHNKRKFAAVALALVGVAGLSVASAATLDLNAGNEVLVGTDTFAECQEGAVNVDYTYDSTSLTIANVVVSDITPACADEAIRIVLKADGATGSLAEVTGTIGTSGTFTAPVPNSIPLATNLGEVAIVIG